MIKYGPLEKNVSQHSCRDLWEILTTDLHEANIPARKLYKTPDKIREIVQKTAKAFHYTPE